MPKHIQHVLVINNVKYMMNENKLVKTLTLASSTFVIPGKPNPKSWIKVHHYSNHAAKTRIVKPMAKKEYASGIKLEHELLSLIITFRTLYEYFRKILTFSYLFRHQDKRRITRGICIKEKKSCDMHDECKDFGGKCCNGFCCNDKYFNEIKNIECISDDGCKVKYNLSFVFCV